MDLYSVYDLISVVKQNLGPKTFFKSLFFGSVKTTQNETIVLDIVKKSRRLPVYVQRGERAKGVQKEGYTTSTFKPPLISLKETLDPYSYQSRSAGEMIGGSRTPQQRYDESVAESLLSLSEQITRAEELQAVQAIRDGKLTLQYDGGVETIDFAVDGTHKVTLAGTNVWGNSASDPTKNLEDWGLLIKKDAGLNPNIIIMGRGAWNDFKAHAKVKEYSDNRRYNMLNIAPTVMNSSGVTDMGYFAELGSSIIVYDEWYIDPADGVQKPLIGDRQVIVASTSLQASAKYAAIPVANDDLTNVSFVDQARVPSMIVERDPVARIVKMESAPLMCLEQPDALVIASV